MLRHFHHVRLFATLWTVTHQASLSMGFSNQGYRTGLPFPPPGGLPNPRMEPTSHVSCIGRWVLYHWHYLGRPEILFYLNIKNILKEIKTVLVYFSITSNDFLSLITTISNMTTFPNRGKKKKNNNQDSAGRKLILENTFLNYCLIFEDYWKYTVNLLLCKCIQFWKQLNDNKAFSFLYIILQ